MTQQEKVYYELPQGINSLRRSKADPRGVLKFSVKTKTSSHVYKGRLPPTFLDQLNLQVNQVIHSISTWWPILSISQLMWAKPGI